MQRAELALQFSAVSKTIFRNYCSEALTGFKETNEHRNQAWYVLFPSGGEDGGR